MKKYGKYEKMPDGTRAKQPAVKSLLLQTYLTSLLCMVLCVAMLLGTTYAWFTSEVTNNGNEIYIGVLDVELKMQVPDGDDADTDPDYVSLSAVTDGSNTTKLYTNAIHWEPGYTSLRTLRVENKGDLAFNYALSFTDGTADGKTNDELLAIAKWFDVWVFDHQSKAYEEPAFYGSINAENGWTQVGTLADVLGGTNVFEGGMDETAVAAKKETAHTYTIALHMNGETAADDQQEALNALMGQSITLNVKLVATQMGSEPDGFGNSNYDNEKIVYVATLEELKTALADGKDAILADDLGDVKTGDIQVNGGIFDGNNHVIVGASSDTNYGLITTTGGTIKNIVVDSNGKSLQGIGAGMTTENPLNQDLYIENVTVYAAYYSVVGTANNVKIVISDSTLHGGISYIGASSIQVKDTTFAFNWENGPQLALIEITCDTSFENCSFDSIYSLGAYPEAKGKTVTLTNCTVGGVKLTAADFVSKLTNTSNDFTGATVANLEDCKIIVDGVEVVWNGA